MGDMVNKKRWTDEEDEFLRENAGKFDLATLARKLNRTQNSVRCRGMKIGVKRIKTVRKPWNQDSNGYTNWTEEEITYLKESWGKVDLNRLSKVLRRSKSAIRVRITSLGLGNYKDNSFYFSFAEISRAFRRSPKSSCYKWHYNKWSKAGLEIKDKYVNDGYIKMVHKDHFWKFAKEHKDLFEWGYLDRCVLDREPAWVEEERRNSSKCKRKYPKQGKFWTNEESNLLVSKVKSNRFTYEELSEEFGRTPSGIRARLRAVGVKNRPLTRRD